VLLLSVVRREDSARAPAALKQSSGVPDSKHRRQGRWSLQRAFLALHGWQAVSALVRVAMRLALLSMAMSISARDFTGMSGARTSNDESQSIDLTGNWEAWMSNDAGPVAFGEHASGKNN
jgi:hypothetical protein